VALLRRRGVGTPRAQQLKWFSSAEFKKKAMKILWIKTVKLVPVDIGGKILSYNIRRKLAGRSEEYQVRKLPCARRSSLTRFGALTELRTQAAFSPANQFLT
jgi:hypothetical protein